MISITNFVESFAQGQSKLHPMNKFQKNTQVAKMGEFVAYLETDVVGCKAKAKKSSKAECNYLRRDSVVNT